MSTFNNVLDEIDNYRKSFVDIESIIYQNNPGKNKKSKKRPSLSAPVTKEQRSSSFSRKSIQSRSLPIPNELPSDVPIPNSVIRKNSSDYFRRESSINRQSEEKRLSKDDIKALIKGAVMKQIENETPKQTETHANRQMRIPGSETKWNNMERRLSKRRSSELDKRKSILRSVRRTTIEQAPEIRTSLLEEIRKAIQMENAQGSDRKFIIADKNLENLNEESSKESNKSDPIASSNVWLEHITERLSLSSKRVSELSKRIAASRKSSMISVDSDDSMTWSQRMNEMDTVTKSKQSMPGRLKNVDSKGSSRQGRDRQFGSSTAPKTSRSNNVSRDSKSRLRRVGSPSVLSDKSSLTHRSDDYLSYSRGRKARSADKERRNSFSNIKVGPVMTRKLEQERLSSSNMKKSKSNLSATHSRSNSYERMKELAIRSSGTKVRSKTALQNNSTERLAKNGTRSRSNCSVGDRFNPIERRSLTKRASLTDLIDLYYACPTRRSTVEALQNYRETIYNKERSSLDSAAEDRNAREGSMTPINQLSKTQSNINLETLEKNNFEDSSFAPDTSSNVSRISMSEPARLEDNGNEEKRVMDENIPKTVKSMKNVDDNNNNKSEEENVDVEQKKKSEKAGRRLSLTGAEILVVPSDAEEVKEDNKRRKSSQRKSVTKSLRRKSENKEVIKNNRKGSRGHETCLIEGKHERKSITVNTGKVHSSLVETNRKTNQADAKSAKKNNSRKVSMETKNAVPKSRFNFETKEIDEGESKLKNIQGKIKNNQETDTKGQQEDNKQRHSFRRISLLRNNKEDTKGGRVSADWNKLGMRNSISTDKLLWR